MNIHRYNIDIMTMKRQYDEYLFMLVIYHQHAIIIIQSTPYHPQYQISMPMVTFSLNLESHWLRPG